MHHNMEREWRQSAEVTIPGRASDLLWCLGNDLNLCLPELCIFTHPAMCTKYTRALQQEAEQPGQDELWDCGARVHSRRSALEFCCLHHIDTVCAWHRLHTGV